ncbi:esterase family protein [Bacillus sp. 165]|uniref:alpha/beta hydrolase n=1 Tax=Bacillus sp. 165 TaxID=1529117 RepID=UPI001ADAEA1D|nr:esterase family protein [Bacillus sp. 165]MBO9128619.1 esterase family protein [Bacillus sp. 165]
MTQTLGLIQELSLYSTSLQEEITLLVYLPTSYTPLLKHTLVIAQDGKDYFQFGKAGKVIEQLQKEGTIERTIIVGIPYKNVEDRKEKYHPNGSQNEAYIRFLAHELVPYLDEHFSTYQVGSGRVLLGDSLGGTVSLMTALMYPHTFGKVIMQSPFVNDTVLNRVKSFTQSHLLELYHIIGTQETHVKTTDGKIRDFVQPNADLNHLLTKKGFPYIYKEFDGDHTWKHWQKDLPSAFTNMLQLK